MLSTNQTELIKQLESTALLNHRYENIKCVNANSTQRRGVMSLVFQAYDKIDADLVAIKVMDPDRLGDKYRLAAFEREPELIESLEGRKRCLQLKESLSNYTWDVHLPGLPAPLRFNCGYFVTQWLEEDVDDYFYKQDQYDPISKLEIFRNILLAIEAIHKEKIFHRDLKIDNIRCKAIGNDKIVVVIDFGTAASIETPNLGTYSKPVGAPAFSPPESFVGFAGDRALGHLSDSYALGSLLFDLFNTREFVFARENDTDFRRLCIAIGTALAAPGTRDRKLQEWDRQVFRLKALTVPPSIDGPGNSLPPAAIHTIKSLYSKLIEFNFRHRLSNLEQALRIVDASIKAIRNTRKQASELHRKRLMRSRRQEKAKRKQERLEMYLNNRLLSNA